MWNRKVVKGKGSSAYGYNRRRTQGDDAPPIKRRGEAEQVGRETKRTRVYEESFSPQQQQQQARHVNVSALEGPGAQNVHVRSPSPPPFQPAHNNQVDLFPQHQNQYGTSPPHSPVYQPAYNNLYISQPAVPQPQKNLNQYGTSPRHSPVYQPAHNNQTALFPQEHQPQQHQNLNGYETPLRSHPLSRRSSLRTEGQQAVQLNLDAYDRIHDKMT